MATLTLTSAAPPLSSPSPLESGSAFPRSALALRASPAPSLAAAAAGTRRCSVRSGKRTFVVSAAEAVAEGAPEEGAVEQVAVEDVAVEEGAVEDVAFAGDGVSLGESVEGGQRLVLKFVWLDKNIGITVDQVVPGKGVVPLAPYMFWPRRDAWEELKTVLESKPWLPRRRVIILLNQATDIINLWQAQAYKQT